MKRVLYQKFNCFVFLKKKFSMTLSDYIQENLSFARYSFSIEECSNRLGKSLGSLRSSLAYHVKKGNVVCIQKGFYLIMDTLHKRVGKLPIGLYIDHLFGYVQKDYYVGLFTASALHGARHQAVFLDYVITKAPYTGFKNRKSDDIIFHARSHWPPLELEEHKRSNVSIYSSYQNVVKRKNLWVKLSDSGTYLVSSPALTAVDLIHYQNKLGGVNRILANIEELSEKMTIEDIETLLSWYPQKSTLRRFGFLLEYLIGKNHTLVLPIKSHLLIGERDQTREENRKNLYPILLTPDNKTKASNRDQYPTDSDDFPMPVPDKSTISERFNWNIDIRFPLDNDLGNKMGL